MDTNSRARQGVSVGSGLGDSPRKQGQLPLRAPRYDWTEDKVYGILDRAFGKQGHVLFPQVPDATGTRHSRTADAIAISTWPSRGLYCTGFEIKVSRSDWRAELSKPDKSSSIQQYCLYWYVVAPIGLIDVAEVPENWGLAEAKTTGTLAFTKQAPRLQPAEVNMDFLCAILRQCSKAMTPNVDVTSKITAEVEKRVENSTRRAKRELAELQQQVAEFQKHSGVNITQQWSHGNIGDAVRVLMRSDRWNGVQLVKRLLSHLDTARETLSEALEECQQTDEATP